jgi:hypothetical protein
VIDAAVALREGRDAGLEQAAVDDLLSAVLARLGGAVG